MNQARVTSFVVKPFVFAAGLAPCAWLVWMGFAGGLGANPVETITLETGQWGLRLLLVTLAITPIRRFTPWTTAIRLRRMLGLFAFFYVCLHFTTYIWLDHSFILADVLDDIIERPYITVGFATFLCLLPLAATSTNAMVRRLGAKRWRNLHRLAYVAGIGAVVHFYWLVKADVREPVIYMVVLLSLFVLRSTRLQTAIRSRQRRPSEANTGT